ncbi:SGNH/GDSL hydrolase family protein [Cohnella nanjingensis]|uniref:SGNH/GDSL hydrolase family protein n=1 Tax=Cohnella nanjingensis TaxID=1387779 RepID=A0A7X0RW10_9BACL|nr:SGNH/GDSL hydrolase family protein [Cohnella nanjingensis]MBB6674688.1 SGNH/GDSL hydrolase family protein [Cohnella nanjingensis]
MTGGLRYAVPRGGLPRLRARLSAGMPIAAAFLGGSITEGYGASEPDATSWRALTEAYLRESSPAGFVSVNAGVGGTNSTFGAYRLGEQVLDRGPIDLLFVEFAVNDDEDRTATIRGMEGIVRQCRKRSPETEIVFVYTADDDNLAEGLPCTIALHEEVAERYGIPSIHAAAAARDRILAGACRWEELAPDRVHPNDAGYALYAACVRTFLEDALRPPREGESASAFHPGVPERSQPLDEDSLSRVWMRGFETAAEIRGFERRETQPGPMINWRYEGAHLVSGDAEGAEIVWHVRGRSAGLLMFCGPDTGMLEYAVNGEAYAPLNPFDDWCMNVYRPVIATFALPEGGAVSRVSVRPSRQRDARSRGHALRIVRLFGSDEDPSR